MFEHHSEIFADIFPDNNIFLAFASSIVEYSSPMMADLLTICFVLVLSALFFRGLCNRYFHPLRKFPGPFWASITTLWYWRAVRYGIYEHISRPLHSKHGTFVRVSPNQLSIADPAAIETIYAPSRSGTAFRKSQFYAGFNPRIGHRQDNFSEQDEAKHTQRRRIVAPLVSLRTCSVQLRSLRDRLDRLILTVYTSSSPQL